MLQGLACVSVQHVINVMYKKSKQKKKISTSFADEHWEWSADMLE